MKIYITVVGLLFSLYLTANVIKGKVTNNKNEPLSNAYVYWLGTNSVVATSESGDFELSVLNVKQKRLVASYVGYLADTLDVGEESYVEIRLREVSELEEVVVSGQKNGIIMSNLKPIKVEQITTAELKKSACCDLAGCFETQNTVQAQTTNIITNSKELRILGLSGVYNQLLLDGLPMVQGLSYTYGVSGIPGVLVENIHISKGANSVVQGFESISGQINVEMKEPGHSDKALLNAYINSYLEKQFNVHYTLKKEKKWSNLTAVHVVQPANRIDNDEDGFLDLPLLTRYMIFNKWKYGNEKRWGWYSNIGASYLNEERIGGQKSYNSGSDKGSTSVYGQLVKINQPQVWTKTGYVFDDFQKISLNIGAYTHNQKSYFGTVGYNARQTSVNSNIQYDLHFGKNVLNMGFSYRYMNLKEDIAFTDTFLHRTYSGNYLKNEKIAGFFAENTLYLFNDKLTWIAGARFDHHNNFGMIFTPRTLLKVDISPETSIRASIGKGWRTVSFFSENIGVLASSRDIVFVEELEPEKAFNYGINFTQKFTTTDESLSGYFSADLYRTDFQNQVFPDYDTDPRRVYVRNFKEKSTSNGFQAEVNFKLIKIYDVKFGYNFLDVFTEANGQKQTLPFNPKHKFLATFSFKPKSNKFNFDVNMHWFGKQRLPDTHLNPVEFQRPDYSETYYLVNAQFTYNFKRFELYAGSENIFGFRQDRPIMSWQNPFGPYFDTSSAWGPTRGRDVYAGIRFRLN